LKRIDELLITQGFVEDLKKAKALIMAGEVFVNEQRVSKASEKFKDNVKIRLKEKIPYVSRAALKLKTALDEFNIDVNGYKCADIGSSTGGFTDLLLQRGASFVYAIDVGTNQLAYKLRIDKRVKVLERTNARYFDFSILDNIDLYTCDVSFISLKLIIKQFVPAMKKGSKALLLIKPQFEVKKEVADKFKGIITDEKIHKEIIKEIKNFVLQYENLEIKKVIESGLKGTHGNKEYIIYFIKN